MKLQQLRSPGHSEVEQLDCQNVQPADHSGSSNAPEAIPTQLVSVTSIKADLIKNLLNKQQPKQVQLRAFPLHT